jgi:hypothetical protein
MMALPLAFSLLPFSRFLSYSCGLFLLWVVPLRPASTLALYPLARRTDPAAGSQDPCAARERCFHLRVSTRHGRLAEIIGFH